METPGREAKGLLTEQDKKLTVMVHPGIHYDIKSMAANNRVTIRELIIEAYTEYLVPKYGKKQKE